MMPKATVTSLALLTIATLTSCSVEEQPVPTRAETFAAIRVQLPKIKKPGPNNLLPEWLIKTCEEIGAVANLNGGGRTELTTYEMAVLTQAAAMCVADPRTAKEQLRDLVAGKYADREIGDGRG